MIKSHQKSEKGTTHTTSMKGQHINGSRRTASTIFEMGISIDTKVFEVKS